jgi:ABC-type transport system involved in multi-copper enzyme maturation permease subunit
MSDKLVRRCTDVTYEFMNPLVGIILLVPFLIVIPIICLVGIVLDLSRTSTSFNQRGYLQGRKITGTIISLSENERRRRLTLEKKLPYDGADRQILAS